MPLSWMIEKIIDSFLNSFVRTPSNTKLSSFLPFDVNSKLFSIYSNHSNTVFSKKQNSFMFDITNRDKNFPILIDNFEIIVYSYNKNTLFPENKVNLIGLGKGGAITAHNYRVYINPQTKKRRIQYINSYNDNVLRNQINKYDFIKIDSLDSEKFSFTFNFEETGEYSISIMMNYSINSVLHRHLLFENLTVVVLEIEYV